jgi:purine-nucleoside phosphorylase
VSVTSLLHIGELVLIRDHINLPQISPLHGPHEPGWGTRFPDMTYAYDPAWIDHVQHQRSKVDHKLQTCTYAFTTGSQLETPAECAYLRLAGADIVGMSTVPEVIAARQCGITVLAFSIVCNMLTTASQDEGVTESSAVNVLKKQNEVLWQVLREAITFVL